MNIQVGDMIEVNVYVNVNGIYTIDSRSAIGYLRKEQVTVIGYRVNHWSSFKEYLLGWSKVNDIASATATTIADLNNLIKDYDSYTYRWWVNDGVKIVKIVSDLSPASLKSDGHICNGCKDWFPMSEPNQSDGSLICWSCREYYGWKYCK